MLIDTHCHLNFKAFKRNLDNVLWQAQVDDVKKIIVPGADLNSSKKAVEMAKSYKNVYAAVGIHPHHSELGAQGSKLKAELRKLAKNNKVVAIGECGLDYYQYKKTKYKNYKVGKRFKKQQKNVFKMQLELAKELKLPVIIHNRQASNDVLKTISNQQSAINNQLRGVFHCFSGDANFLKRVLDKGFYIGFDGNLTYNKSLQHLAKITPLNRILLETDSPFLTPEPLRSQKMAWRSFPNKPENVKIIAQFLAKIKGVSFNKIAQQTTKNARKIFFKNSEH